MGITALSVEYSAMKGDFNTSVGFISWDTDHPPDPTTSTDVIIATEVLLFIFINLMVILSIVVNRKHQRVLLARPWLLCLMIVGAINHVSSVFISNGFLTSIWFFEYLRTAWCPLWDLWISYGFGYNLYFVPQCLCMYMWSTYIQTLHRLSKLPVKNAIPANDHEKLGIPPPDDVYFDDGVESEMKRMDIRNVVFPLACACPIYVICVVLSLTGSTEYEAETGWCETELLAKILVISWIVATVVTMVSLLLFVRKLKDLPFVAYEDRKMSIVTGVVFLLILILINVSGISVSWWGRAIDINVLMLMYSISIGSLLFAFFVGTPVSISRTWQQVLIESYTETSDPTFAEMKEDNTLMLPFFAFMERLNRNYYISKDAYEIANKIGHEYARTIEGQETDDDKMSPIYFSSDTTSSLDFTFVLNSRQLSEFYRKCCQYTAFLSIPQYQNADQCYAYIIRTFFHSHEKYTEDQEVAYMEEATDQDRLGHVLNLPLAEYMNLYGNINRYHFRTETYRNRLTSIIVLAEAIMEFVFLPLYKERGLNMENCRAVCLRRALDIAVRQGLTVVERPMEGAVPVPTEPAVSEEKEQETLKSPHSIETLSPLSDVSSSSQNYIIDYDSEQV